MQDDTKDPTDTAPETHVEEPREPGALDKMWRFACEHPVLSIFGAAGIGLLGGVELAGGVLIGAGVAAALRGTRGDAPERSVRERARSMISRAPHDVKERARAVVDAVRRRGDDGTARRSSNGKQPH